jgi:hypothetical protein
LIHQIGCKEVSEAEDLATDFYQVETGIGRLNATCSPGMNALPGSRTGNRVQDWTI